MKILQNEYYKKHVWGNTWLFPQNFNISSFSNAIKARVKNFNCFIIIHLFNNYLFTYMYQKSYTKIFIAELFIMAPNYKHPNVLQQ